VFTRCARTSPVGSIAGLQGRRIVPKGRGARRAPGPRNRSGAVHDTFTPSHRGGSGSPLVCLHGFTDTWRTWELVLPALERRHDVLAPTLPGHAGGPPLAGEIGGALLADAVERAMDEAGFGSAHIVGNSLGGYVALQLAARGRAHSVVALAPAGGWAEDDDSFLETLDHFTTMQELLRTAAPHAEAIVATPAGRRRATEFITTRFEHIPPGLIAHQIVGAAACEAVGPLIELALREGWSIEAERITCPVRVVWGTDDRLLAWPSSAARFRHDWLPHADWVELAGVGHCPQLDVPLEAAELILGFTAR
jgi:pimeloyl-ACP methyl ester carboxylesterase